MLIKKLKDKIEYNQRQIIICKIIIYILFSVFFFHSCSLLQNDQYDGKNAALKYCECLKREQKGQNLFYAKKICEAEMIKRNLYFRIFMIDFEIESLKEKHSRGMIDSTLHFIHEFYGAVNENCFDDNRYNFPPPYPQ